MAKNMVTVSVDVKNLKEFSEVRDQIRDLLLAAETLTGRLRSLWKTFGRMEDGDDETQAQA